MTTGKIDLNNLDKSGWQKVKFGDVVFEPKESVKDPVADNIEHVVGLEHIDSEDIHLRRSGNLDKSTTFTKKFSEGDVLFGRRRAYLKKAAQANFSGICSGDITVMRANDRLLPELLPFVVNNDKFFDWAVDHSAGSLSPRVKFKDLANYEFFLPPKNQQTKIAELFWLINNVVDESERFSFTVKRLFESKRECLNFGLNLASDLEFNKRLKTNVNKNISFGRLENSILSIKYGTSKKGNFDNVGKEVIGIPNVVNETLFLGKVGYVDLTDKEYKLCKLEKGDIVIVRTNGNPDYTGRCALYDIDDGHCYASYLIKISPNPVEYDPEFLVRYLQTRVIRRFFRRHATSTAGNYNINTEAIKAVPVPLISLVEQQKIVAEMKVYEKIAGENFVQLGDAVYLQKSLINQVF